MAHFSFDNGMHSKMALLKGISVVCMIWLVIFADSIRKQEHKNMQNSGVELLDGKLCSSFPVCPRLTELSSEVEELRKIKHDEWPERDMLLDEWDTSERNGQLIIHDIHELIDLLIETVLPGLATAGLNNFNLRPAFITGDQLVKKIERRLWNAQMTSTSVAAGQSDSNLTARDLPQSNESAKELYRLIVDYGHETAMCGQGVGSIKKQYSHCKQAWLDATSSIDQQTTAEVNKHLRSGPWMESKIMNNKDGFTQRIRWTFSYFDPQAQKLPGLGTSLIDSLRGVGLSRYDQAKMLAWFRKLCALAKSRLQGMSGSSLTHALESKSVGMKSIVVEELSQSELWTAYAEIFERDCSQRTHAADLPTGTCSYKAWAIKQAPYFIDILSTPTS